MGAMAAPCHSYDKPATITGKIVFKTFFGPPNFGENPETDARETQALLIPSKPFCVNADDEYDLEKNQIELTLVPPRGVKLKKFGARQVTVEGSLFHADNGHHNTTILMMVKRIEEVRK
jgi:hypothetical protein